MVDLEDKTRKYLEEKVKIYAHFMLGFGNIEASEEMVANRELIKNKKGVYLRITPCDVRMRNTEDQVFEQKGN
jgi:hypothetical protein